MKTTFQGIQFQVRRAFRFLTGNPLPRIRIVRTGGQVAFTPVDLRIPKNEEVFWLNEDNVPHQISLTGEIIAPGQTSAEIIITGSQGYSCTLHPEEKGTITTEGTV